MTGTYEGLNITIYLFRRNDKTTHTIKCIYCGYTILKINRLVARIVNSEGQEVESLPRDVGTVEHKCRYCKCYYKFYI